MAADLFYDERLGRWVCLNPECLAAVPEHMRCAPLDPATNPGTRDRGQSSPLPSIDSRTSEEVVGST